MKGSRIHACLIQWVGIFDRHTGDGVHEVGDVVKFCVSLVNAVG